MQKPAQSSWISEVARSALGYLESLMAANQLPLIVPCHRVVPARGGLGGFSAPRGINLKRRLLEQE